MTVEHVIVVGASAGGVEALLAFAGGLPEDLDAAVCIVLHQPANVPSALPRLLARAGPLPAAHAQDAEPLEPRRLYVAPPDHHLLVKRDHLTLTRGPVENGHRPAIDPLFRTAAREYGPATIAVVLSGSLDDGSAGAALVESEGGRVVVQDLDDALYPEMPRNAARTVRSLAGTASAAELGALLARLVADEGQPDPTGPARQERDPSARDPDPAELEADPVGSDHHHATLSCPTCSGPMVERIHDGELRFRCRVGHGWSLDALASQQGGVAESALWQAVRLLEERITVVERLVDRARARHQTRAVAGFQAQIADLSAHAGALRAVLATGHTTSQSDGDVVEASG